jgi:hypothetical protein
MTIPPALLASSAGLLSRRSLLRSTGPCALMSARSAAPPVDPVSPRRSPFFRS